MSADKYYNRTFSSATGVVLYAPTFNNLYAQIVPSELLSPLIPARVTQAYGGDGAHKTERSMLVVACI